MLNWFGAACVRAGNGNVQRTRSSLAIEWGSVLPDRSLLRWATKRLAPFRLPLPIQNPYPHGLPPLPQGPPVAQAALPERRTFTPQETRIIDAASSIQPTDPRPPIYDLMMEEGRTLPRIEALLQEAFIPTPDAESPVHIFVSADLVRDVKDLRFGFNNDLSFEICHRGISPFTVTAMSHEQASSRKRLHERMSRVSSLTSADVARMESQPNPCPRTCDGLLRLLATYQKLLTVLFGTHCKHFLEVRIMRRMLVEKYHQYAQLPAESIAQLLWNVHVDARRFFSTPLLPDGTLPQSQLRCANAWLDSGSIKRIENCPLDRLLGVPSAPAAAPLGPPATAMPDWMPAATPEHVNNNVHPLLAAAVLPARYKRATVKVTELMLAATPPVTYTNVKLGISGGCLDFGILGKRANPQCTYSHAACATVPDARAREIVRHLQPGIDAFINT